MKIFTSVPDFKQEHKKNEDFLSEVLDRIFLISKTDPFFASKNKTEHIDLQLKETKIKVNKKKDLLKKSNLIESDLSKAVNDLDDQNYKMKVRLLEILGSELWI